jgi:hypothetical protein
MRVLCDRLVGKMAWYAEPSAITSNTTLFARRANRFGVVEFPSRRIGLYGSLNLDAFFEFDEENGLYEDKNVSRIFDLSDQQLRVKVLARNRTLEVLIEELSFNTTISLMHNALPINLTNTIIRLTTDVNRCSFKAYGLFIPYALANFPP